MNISKQQLQDERFEYIKNYRENNFDPRCENFNEFLKKSEKMDIYISDFIQWFIERNFKK